MTTISDERLAEMLAEVEIDFDNALLDAEADQNPQLAVDPVGEFDLIELRSILSELLALRAQGGARVKPLEWSQGWGERCAATPFGNYQLSTNTTGHFDWHSPDGERHWASTEDAAKAAAQVDYERRILSAIEASPAPVSEEMVDRALSCWCSKLPKAQREQPIPEKLRDHMRATLTAALAAKGGQ